MKRYTVTITPDDGQGAQTVVHLEVTGSAPRITELRLKADDENGLSASQLPAIDLELLLKAVLPATKPSGRASVATATAAPEIELHGTANGVVSPQRGGRRASAGKAAVRAARPRPARAAKGDSEGRIYRTMPDDFAASFAKTSQADLATVYQVPRHTIQSWISTARKQGKIPPARPRQRHRAS